MTNRSLTHLIIAFVVLAVAAGAYGFWYYQVQGAAARAATLEAEIAATIERSVMAAEAGDTLAELAIDEAVIESYRIRLDDIVAFLETVEGTGRGLGTSVEVVTVADKPGTDGRIALTVRILGSFDGVLRTLGAVEYGPYDSRITNLTFDTPADSNAWTAVAALSVAVETP